MVLADLIKGEKATIKKIFAVGELKNRFSSLGLYKGTEVYLDEYSIAKSTLKVIIGNTILALRKQEAKLISIEKNA